MRNLLKLVQEAQMISDPWPHLRLHGVELPTINWHGAKRRVFARRYDLLDRVPGAQSVLTGSRLQELLEEKWGELDFNEHVTNYFLDSDGYSLGPHTEIKVFTMIFYQTDAEVCLCSSEERAMGGRTPWYNMETIQRTTMRSGSALLFRPWDHTWHGTRPAEGRCRSIQHFYMKKGTTER